jgi:hypothetical protein
MAASAGPTVRQASGLGRTFRGVFVARGASSDADGSNAPSVTQRSSRSSKTLLALTVAAVAALLLASPGSAATVTQRPLLFTFDGTANAGPLTDPQSIAIDNATDDVYIANDNYPKEGFISKFTAAGAPVSFSATGTSSLRSGIQGSVLGIAVDNSGSANQGRLLFSDFGSNELKSFAPSGELQWSLVNSAGQVRDVTLDASGHPWAVDGGTTTEYANTGTPPVSGSSLSAGGPKVEVDANGNVYVLQFGGELRKYVGGVSSSAFDPNAEDVYADQSSTSGHIFTVDRAHNEFQEFQVDATSGQFRLSFQGEQTTDLPLEATYQEVTSALEALPSIGAGNVQAGAFGSDRYYVEFKNLIGGANVEQVACEDGTTPLSGGTGCSVSTTTQGVPGDFEEYEASGTHLATFGTEYLDAGSGIAYNPSLDHVYVLEGGAKPSVSVFGPTTTGTVADATIEDPSATGVSSAHFSGTVNPQGTSSEWHFEWRKQGQSWAQGGSSPAQSLPADSSDHTVEYTTSALRGTTSYQVRLVAVNTANQLVGISSAKLFGTATASQAPTVMIAAPSVITEHSVKITGTVNPEGDTADWRVQISTDPVCASGFENELLKEVSPASLSPVPVEYEVTGLLPSQHYCARIVASNSAGSTTSDAKEFETSDTNLTQVFTAYASRRADTNAVLNGYVNPEGSEPTYRFEYSQDGLTWTTLPDQIARSSRQQIAVSEELTGLLPSTTYHYRFLVENAAGLEEGGEKVFTTRTSAEMQVPVRGIELVNQPDKGNQNIVFGSIGSSTATLVSPDGNRAIWGLTAGAPGGNSGTGVNFLAIRTPNGWTNRSLLPPADEQVGGGAYAYKLNNITPDLRHFVARASQSGATHNGPPTYVRLDDQQHQDVLLSLQTTVHQLSDDQGSDITDDGSHVLLANHESEQIEDISGGAPEVVSVMPDGTPSECGVPAQGFAVRATGYSGPQLHAGYHRMASTDGARLYFQTRPNGQPCEEFERRAIYYRDRNAGQTVEVDAGLASDSQFFSSSQMIRATPDGKALYFFTENPHVAEDTNEARDIYRWDAEPESYTCLTCAFGGGVSTQPVLVSDDFSHVYFTSTRQLNGYGNVGHDNLYVLRHGTLGFIGDPGNETFGPTSDATLSADGSVLTWLQGGGNANLTGDQLPSECLSNNTSCPQEIYRYDDSTESLECISCAADRSNSQGVSREGPAEGPALSTDGSTAAFSTKEALVPQDINGTYDIYQWRNGALGLVSDGETEYSSTGFGAPPKVWGIDATGDNVFFTLVDKGLTGYEQDGYANLYDARVGGGFPRPEPQEHCSEESCQGPLQAQPAQAQAGSSGFSGAGNVVAADKGRCANKRGKARSRCLHPHKHKRRQRKKRHAAHRAAKRAYGGAK